MTEFVRINPRGKTDRELLLAIADGQNKTHECIHTFQAAQGRFNETLATSVGELKTNQEVDSGRITTLAKLFGAEKVEPGEAKPKGKGIATWSAWKVVGSLGGGITGAGLLYQFLRAIWPSVDAFLMALK